MSTRRALGMATVGLLLAAGSWSATATPRVVATVAPVHSLVAAIMAGVGEPHLLIRGIASPHDFVLRPSDRRALGEAQLVFWVGEGLESFLPRVLAVLDKSVRTVELARLEGVERLPQRAGGIWAAAAHAEPSTPERDEHRHGAATGYNPHLWLDPRNASRWALGMVDALSAVDPANAVRYRRNGEQLQAGLKALDGELQQALAPVHATPYVVFHDAYHYLEHRYQLSPAGSVSLGDGRAPGARRLHEIRQLFNERGAYCIFTEPQFEPRIIRTLVEGTAVRVSELDPLGARIAPGPELYFRLMRELSRSLVECLRD